MEELGPSDDTTGQGTQWYCFDSVDEDTLATGTPYYLALMEVSGTVVWFWDTDGSNYDGDFYNAGSGWTLGSTASNDMNFRIYTWQ